MKSHPEPQQLSDYPIQSVPHTAPPPYDWPNAPNEETLSHQSPTQDMGCYNAGFGVWWREFRFISFIPVELLSWRRWLTFAVVFSVFILMFGFIPTDSTIIDADDPPEVHWSSMVPPLLCISFASCFGMIILGLFLGMFVGGLIAFKGNPYLPLEQFVFASVWDEYNAYILGFTIIVVGLILLLRRANGLDSMLFRVTRLAKTSWATRVMTSVGCLLFFFDDYSNCVISGTMWRSLYDKMQVSRQKLAYIVDSTAAPLASVALISTWISYELSVIQETVDGLNQDNEADISLSAYDIFLTILGMRFYCWAALCCVFSCVLTDRDFGPMLAVERKIALCCESIENTGTQHTVTPRTPYNTNAAAKTKALKPIDYSEPDAGAPLNRWYLAVVPLLCLFFGTIFGMFLGGLDAVEQAGESTSIWNPAAWRIAFGNAPSSFVLFWVSVVSTFVAIALTVYCQAVTCESAFNAVFFAIPTMSVPCAILVLAWSIKAACDELGTANYMVSILGGVNLPFMPAVIYLISVVTALCTGTSWGTMGIVLPIALNMMFVLGDKDSSTDTGLTHDHENLWYLTAAAVLDGAVMGDHISPISDTSVLSATSSGCDVLDHIKTQLPYACVCGVAALTFGYIGAGGGLPVWAYFVCVFTVIPAIFMVVGSRLPTPVDRRLPKEDQNDSGRPSLVQKMCIKCNCGEGCEAVCVFCGCIDNW